MKRSALTSLRTILRAAAAALGVERAAHEALVQEIWPEVAGEGAAHSRPAGLRGTTLVVEVEPGLWIQELSARRGGFVEEINRRLGAGVVTEVRLRPRTGPSASARPADDAPQPAPDPAPTAEDLDTIERTVAEIADPEIRAATRSAMLSQLKWRKRHATTSRPSNQ